MPALSVANSKTLKLDRDNRLKKIKQTKECELIAGVIFLMNLFLMDSRLRCKCELNVIKSKCLICDSIQLMMFNSNLKG